MAESRIHPASIDANHSDDPSKPLAPQPITYVFQFPREQILRYPPPENATKYENLSRRKNRRSCCRRCCCYTFCLLLLLIISAAVSAGVLYLVFRFKSPKYTVTKFTITGMNETSTAPISPRFNLTIRAKNPNGKVGIYYLKGNSVRVYYNRVNLSRGVFHAFYQPKKNVTSVHAVMIGSELVLNRNARGRLRREESQRRVPFVVRVTVPVKIKVGSVKTWKITVNVKCDVVVDELSQRANIISNVCDYSVKLW